MKVYRDLGYDVEKVERTIGAGKFCIRKDFIGCGDLMAWKPGRYDELCQVTTMSNRSSHYKKILDNPEVRDRLAMWLKCTNHKFVFHFWRKLGKQGKRKTWQLKVEELTL